MIYIYKVSEHNLLITKQKRNYDIIFACSGKCEFKGSEKERAERRKKRMKYEIKNKAYRKAYNKKYYEKTKLKKLKNKHIGI